MWRTENLPENRTSLGSQRSQAVLNPSGSSPVAQLADLVTEEMSSILLKGLRATPTQQELQSFYADTRDPALASRELEVMSYCCVQTGTGEPQTSCAALALRLESRKLMARSHQLVPLSFILFNLLLFSGTACCVQ